MEKTLVTLPSDPNEIVRRMSMVNDESNIVEKLYSKIAEHAGQELTPAGVVMLLTLALSDFQEQYPPMVGNILTLFMPRWIDALIDDKRAAGQAKKMLETAKEDARKDREARTPARVEPTGPIEDDNLYLAVMKIADIFFEEVEKADTAHLISVEHRNDSANPYHDQTESGLFVEYYYGHPSKIWTPWGYYAFTGGVGYRGDAPWEVILKNFCDRLGATLHTPETNNNWGTYGPVYAIHKVDDIKLPEPKVREHQNYLEYDVAKRAWENMTNRYKSEK